MFCTSKTVGCSPEKGSEVGKGGGGELEIPPGERFSALSAGGDEVIEVIGCTINYTIAIGPNIPSTI